jgi:AraC-like DNA-binding protein
VGLERSCARRDWVRCGEAEGGVQRMSAWFAGAAFARHRHDTYAIGLTDSGVQRFYYRGEIHSAVRGDAVVLHPDEPHDGFAGTAEGFGYRILYVEPARVAAAVRAATGRARALPFVRRPVVKDVRLARTLRAAFDCALEPLAADAIVLQVTGLLLEESFIEHPVRIDVPAVERARKLLDAASDRVVRSAELEAASGLSRFDLARQFRALLGTSPYRYSLLRRLAQVKKHIHEKPIIDLALEAGFADQAHFTRAFRRAFGVTPARYRRLSVC